MINNSISNVYSALAFQGKHNKQKAQAEQKTEQKEQTVSNPDNEVQEEYTFESTAKKQKDNDAKLNRALLRNALVGLTLVSAPFVYTAATDYEDNNRIVFSKDNFTDEDIAIFEKADSLAKTGRDSTVLEADEFLQLLDYSKIGDMPKLDRKNAIMIAKSGFLPINMGSQDAKKEIINQVKNAQYSINRLGDSYNNNPPKSHIQRQMEYARNNITDREILENVDFSELSLYQNDMTVLKALINYSRDNIKRDDADASKKKQEAIKNAQKLVDNITNQYKTRASVSGNYDGNQILSKGELASLLSFKCLNGLPEELQFRIIAKALEDYNPRNLSHVKDKEQVERENQKVEEDKQKAQERLNDWAYRAHREFYHLLNPDKIMVIQKD